VPSRIFSPANDSEQIWMDELGCNGTEASLEDCARNDWGEHDCTHFEDVSISCQPNPLAGTQSI